MPKIDPETQQLYDEINGMIQKFKVKFLKRKIKQLIKIMLSYFTGRSKGEGRLLTSRQMW